MAKEIDVVVNVKTKKAEDSLSTLEDDFARVGKKVEDFKEEVEDLEKPLEDAGKGVQSLGQKFKALMTNPIVLVISAIVGALVALGKVFTKTSEGAEQMEMTMGKISTAIDVVIKRVGKFAGGLLKLFTGDIKGGFTQMKESFIGIADEMRTMIDLQEQIILLQREMTRERIENNVLVAAWTRDMEKQLDISKNTTKTFAERKIALSEALELELKIQEAMEKEQADALLLAQMNLQKNKDLANEVELQEKLSEEAAKYIELEAQGNNANEQYRIRLAEIMDEEAEKRAEYLESIELEKIKKIELFDLEMDLKLQQSEFEKELMADLVKENDATNKILIQQEKQKLAEEFALMQKQEMIKAQLKQAIERNTFGVLKIMAGENAKLQKAVAVAQVIWETGKAAMAMLTAGAQTGPAGLALGPIAAASAIAFGVAQVYKIMSTDVGTGGSPGGGGMSVPRASGVSARDISEIVNEPLDYTQNVNIANQQNMPPIKAYVVSRDVTSQQDLDKRIEAQAEI